MTALTPVNILVCPKCYHKQSTEAIAKRALYHIKCTHCGTYYIPIDQSIVSIMVELWKRHIVTHFCCGGHVHTKKLPHVIFAYSEKLLLFLTNTVYANPNHPYACYLQIRI